MKRFGSRLLNFGIGLAVLSGLMSAAHAAPIYMYREPDGVIRFSSKPPAHGVRAEVFSGKGARYSIVGRRGGGPVGRLFLDRYQTEILAAAETHAVDPALVLAVIHAESAFNPKAVSPKGAQGLMQLMPLTAKSYGVTEPFDAAQNIGAGTKHLSGLLKRFDGNLRLALAAYNAGEEAVKRYGGLPPYQETRQYVDRVLHLKSRYRIALPAGEPGKTESTAKEKVS